MHAGSPLSSILYVLAAALVSAAVLARLRQPNIIGYLIGGLLIGPNGLQLVPYENVELLAEIGIGLLMFTIGVELSIPSLLRVRNVSIFGGTLIVAVITAICFLIAPFFRWGVSESIVWGLTLGLSSTVVVLKLLAERGEVGSTHANISTGILLFQDVVSIPILVFIPLLAAPGESNAAWSVVASVTGRLLIFLLLIYFIGRFLVPRLLRFVANTHSKELFSISVLCLTLAVAALSAKAGLSLALGAFLAGLIVSESDFGNQAASEVLPMKDAFSAVFFVSVGMLLDFGYFIEKWPTFTFGLAIIVTLKFFVVLAICFLFRYQSKISVFVAISLAQIGEFGFLILLSAKHNKLISDGSYQRLLGISILSIIATPYLLKLYPKVKRAFVFMNRTSWVGRPLASAHTNFYEEKGAEPASEETKLQQHVIVCGYGPTGSIVAKRLQSLGMQVVIVDLNYKVIQSLKAAKQYAVYGDSSSLIVLEAAGLHQAALLVVTIPDPFAMQALVKKVKAEHPSLPIVMRVKYMSDRDKLLSLGADDIVWEEYEAGLELTRRAMDRLNIQET